MWTTAFTQNARQPSPAGGTSGTWSLSFPVPNSGGPFRVQAEARDTDGQLDPIPAVSDVQIGGVGNPPETTITSPFQRQIIRFPGGVRQVFNITVTGTATDQSGVQPGVRRVNLVVVNLEHNEYFCGPPGCGGGESNRWSPVYTVVPATLASPDATSTTWSLTISTYDHPHDYRITAWAVDRDGQADQTRAKVARFCVRDLGTTTCG
jgi:hypothetical protein